MRTKVYNIISDCTAEQHAAIDAICDRFMTIDTVSAAEAHEWYAKNALCLLAVTRKNTDKILGYMELLPLTEETGPKLFSGQYCETDVYPEHVLDASSMQYAQYAYIAAIAVDKPDSFTGGCCALSLMAGSAKQLLTLYDKKYLKRLFINPTTKSGNALANKLGFLSTTPKVRTLRSSHMYYMDMNEKAWKNIQDLHDRFGHLINYPIT